MRGKAKAGGDGSKDVLGPTSEVVKPKESKNGGNIKETARWDSEDAIDNNTYFQVFKSQTPILRLSFLPLKYIFCPNSV